MPTPRYRSLAVAAGGLLVAIGTVTAPAPAVADPLGDFMCGVGSTAPEFCMAAPPPARSKPHPTTPESEPTAPNRHLYANCADARAHGVTPLHRWDPGYSARLDPDGDGIACGP